MSDGVKHLTASLVLDLGVAYLCYEAINLHQDYVVSSLVTGTLLGTFITPDYDLEGTTVTENLIKKIPVLGVVWITLWFPYALLNPHRGRSHSLLGTIERQFYLLLLIDVVLIFWIGLEYVSTGNVTLPLSWLYYTWLPAIDELIIIVAVWYVHDLIHYFMDGIQ